MKMKDEEDHILSSKLKPISMSKTKATSSKAEKKKALVRLRLSLLEEQGTDEISDGSCVQQEQLTPVPTPEPLEISRPTKTKRSVQQSTERSGYSNSSAMKRAKEVQANLSDEFPILVRCMLPSHVASCFWLGLPKKFCVEHLPKSDTEMELIEESGDISIVKYLPAKTGISGGWRGFAIAHNLVEGDVVVFHLVKKTTFKVYIIRKNALTEIDGALGLLNLDTCDDAMASNDDDSDDDNEDDDDDYDDSDDDNEDDDDDDDSDDYNEDDDADYDGDEKENESEDQDKILSGSPSSEDVGSEALDWIKLSEPDESAKLESFDKFSILLDGSVSINAKFPDHIRKKYYNLCSNQNSSLHEKLLKGLNCPLVVGIINETINIFDAIRSNTSKVPESDLLTYDKTLQGFELLGMNVGFIRLEIQKLMRRVIEDEEAVAVEAKMERAVVGQKMKKFKVKLLELKKQMEEMDEEIEVIEERTARKRLKLKEMENSP